MWLYKYPLSQSYVPTNIVWFIILVIPTLLFTIEYILKRNKKDICEAILCITLIYALNGFLTSYLKVLVGRPRPDFYERCKPDGMQDGLITCTGDQVLIMDGRKSFPSGHSSFSFCSMTFLSLYIAGKLQLFNHSNKVESWKLISSLIPLLVAISIAISRTCDYHHHWQGDFENSIFLRIFSYLMFLDVTVGSMLGTTIAYFCYHLYFPPLSSSYSHLSYATQNVGIEN